jgi:hypothetical protein
MVNKSGLVAQLLTALWFGCLLLIATVLFVLQLAQNQFARSVSSLWRPAHALRRKSIVGGPTEYCLSDLEVDSILDAQARRQAEGNMIASIDGVSSVQPTREGRPSRQSVHSSKANQRTAAGSVRVSSGIRIR